MRVGIFIPSGDNATLDGLVARISKAEQDGFASAWVPQIFGIDALTALAFAGRQTSRIELGTAVVPTYPRHPHSLAQQAATVNVAADGRLVLGIGRSHKLVIESMFGLPYEKPITHMREYVSVLRALTTDGKCAIDGKLYKVNAPLTIDGAKPLPVMIGALMPKMLELCGELCDGTLTWMTGPKHIANNIVPVLERAAKAAGREVPRVVCSLPVCITDNPEQARATAAKAFAMYNELPVYRACLDEEGAAGPADLALVGSEKDVEAALGRLRDAGATDFSATFFPSDGQPTTSTARSYEFFAGLRGSV